MEIPLAYKCQRQCNCARLPLVLTYNAFLGHSYDKWLHYHSWNGRYWVRLITKFFKSNFSGRWGNAGSNSNWSLKNQSWRYLSCFSQRFWSFNYTWKGEIWRTFRLVKYRIKILSKGASGTSFITSW